MGRLRGCGMWRVLHERRPGFAHARFAVEFLVLHAMGAEGHKITPNNVLLQVFVPA